MGFLEFFASIVWIAAGLAVFLSVTFFFLPYIYEDWKNAKGKIDTESAWYQLVLQAYEEHVATKEPIIIHLSQEPPEGYYEKDTESTDEQQLH